MSDVSEREAARRALAREIALFRFRLIQEALDPGLTAKQRGRVVRAVVAVEHPGPHGMPVRVSRATLDRWLRAYRTGGFTALIPVPRRLVRCTPGTVLELAVALKKEAPGRTAAQIAAILTAQAGWAPSQRTLQRHFADLGITRTRPDGSVPAAFGRFEAERPNARWVGDALHGPVVAGRKAILIAFLDDHSRLVVAARWGYHENAMALREILRAGLGSRGYPKVIYVDNGSMFIDSALRRTCAVIGAKLTHSQAGRPQGRGKIERFFRTVRDQFLVEIADQDTDQDPGQATWQRAEETRTGTPVASLADLNALFDAWLHQVYHQRVHSETEQTPLQRFLAHGAPAPVPGDILVEAFRWSEWRRVTSTAQVNLHGNLYDVDPSLVGKRVELVFDPSSPSHLDDIDVRVHSTSYGKAIPSLVRRHVHPKAGGAPAPAPAATGIDYLRLVQARHTQSLQARLQYAHLDPQTAPTPAADDAPAPATSPHPTDQQAADTGPDHAGTDHAGTDHAGGVDDEADDEAWDYETDLVALAAADTNCDTSSEIDPDPGTGISDGPGTVTDPALAAELTEFAALLHNRDHDTHHETAGDQAGDHDPGDGPGDGPGDDPGDAGDGQRQVTR